MEKGISVIIPTYNRDQFVAECIQSVLNQDYKGNLEIIISDDGSTDKTLEIATTFQSKVKIIRKPFNCKTQGVAATRNRGIHVSSQPYICFLDSDDFFLPGHLKRISEVLENEPELGFAFCRVLEIEEKNGIKLFRPWTRDRIFKNDIKNPCASRSHIVHTNSFLFKKEVFDKTGVFNEKYTLGEDGDQWMRISEQFKGKFVDYFGAVYRIDHGTHQLTKKSGNEIKKCNLLIFEAAKRRYYKFKLKDSKRIYKIKYNLLWFKYRDNDEEKYIYYFLYLFLIIRYPIGYLQTTLEYCYMKKEIRGWNPIEKYINKQNKNKSFISRLK
jgi:glycosyltransferase involved in cell wall biosynthesis